MSEPLYRPIAEDLRQKIESGELPGEQGRALPTEIDLREEYGASRNTVRDAIKWLTTLGVVETRPGQGTFVVERITPFVTTLTEDPETGRGGGDEVIYLAEVAASDRIPTTTDPVVEIQRADKVLARALRLEEGAPVVSRHQQRFIDGTPWSLQTTFYPMSLVTQGATRLIQAATIPQGAVAYVGGAVGIRQAGYRDTISVRPPDEKEASFLRLPADGHVSVFEIHRIGFDANGDRIRLTVTVYPADRNRFRIPVGDVPPRGAPETGA